jgi:hypothetical protein
MDFTVHITLTALREIDRRFARIRRQAPRGASRWLDRILAAIDFAGARSSAMFTCSGE